MQKLQDSDWNGAVFAAAGLERINLKPENYIDLDWMVPAPAQGAMVVVAMENDDFCKEALSKLNHSETEICTQIEREFLKTLEGGCTAPIGALATFTTDKIDFEGVLFSLDGKEKHTIKKSCTFDSYKNFGKKCAEEILNNGGTALMESIRRDLKK
jgi:hydroxymethylbilane synthase